MPNVVDSILGQPLVEYAAGYRKHREDKYEYMMEYAAQLAAQGTEAGANASANLQRQAYGMVEPWGGTTEKGMPTIALMGQPTEDKWNRQGSDLYKRDTSKTGVTKEVGGSTGGTASNYLKSLGNEKDYELPENVMSPEEFEKQFKEKYKQTDYGGIEGIFNPPTKEPDNYITQPLAYTQVANPQNYMPNLYGKDTLPQLGAQGVGKKGRTIYGKLPMSPAAHYIKDKHGKYKLVKEW